MERALISRQWTKADVDQLIETSDEESQVLDYKESLPDPRNESAKRELCADVTAFANADGGVLVFGVGEEMDGGQSTGKPRPTDIGLGTFDPDKDESRIRQILASGVEPFPPDIALDVVDGFSGGPVAVLRVMRGWRGPFLVKHERETVRFCVRRGRDKSTMKWTELEASFGRGERAAKLASQFAEERIGKILSGTTPIPLPIGQPVVVLHLVPLGQLVDGGRVSLQNAARSSTLETLIPQGGGGYGTFPPRYNADGLVVGDAHLTEPTEMSVYTQFFRNGCVEHCVANSFARHDKIGLRSMSAYLAKECERFSTLLSELSVLGPISIRLTLLNVRGWEAAPFGESVGVWLGRPIDRDVLSTPEAHFENGAFSKDCLREPFDALWHACGFPYSPDFTEAGLWAPDQTDRSHHQWNLRRGR